MKIRISRIALVFCMAFLVPMVIGEEPSDPIDTALTNGSSPVWFDADRKELTFPSPKSLQTAEDALIDRHRHMYIESPTSNATPFWNGWDALVRFLSGAVFWILFGLLIAFLVAVVVYLWLVFDPGRSFAPRKNRAQSLDDTERDRAKIIDLPFNIDIPSSGLLEQAEAFRRDGEYSNSIVYLYSHVLVELDEADCIRLQRGKTNRAYLRELHDQSQLEVLHRFMVEVFEAVFFGRYSIDRELCDRCWNLLPAIRSAIEEARQRRLNAAEQTEVPASSPVRETMSAASAMSLYVLLGLGCVGCHRDAHLPVDEYGGCNSYSRKSVSGLTVFRDYCELQGSQTFELNSLSNRAFKLDTIVWAPKDFRAPSSKEMEWFERWLSSDIPRTLIYIGRDYSPTSHYWRRAVEKASPEDRRTFRLQQAYADSEIEAARLRSESPLKCDWFELPLAGKRERRVDNFLGPWSRDHNAAETNIVLRGPLLPNPEPRSVPLVAEEAPTDLLTSEIAESESETDQALTPAGVTYGPPTIETLLASDEAVPIITSISYRPWNQGRLLLVTNGSFLMNESLTYRGNQALAKRLIAECPQRGRIGFLSSDGETRIRLPWDEEEPKGFEWLRVWPLSLIAIQSLFLGSIGLLAMLPIFGRPQRLPSPSTTDFGKHIEALGDLLSRSRDRNYALQRIADYFRDVRRDFASPWSMVAPPVHSSEIGHEKPGASSSHAKQLEPGQDAWIPTHTKSDLAASSSSPPTSQLKRND